MSFMELGRKLDNFIQDAFELNRNTPWYKVYAYHYINQKIKNNKFQSEQNFDYFMSTLNGHVWKWQEKKLCKNYRRKNRKEEKRGGKVRS